MKDKLLVIGFSTVISTIIQMYRDNDRIFDVNHSWINYLSMTSYCNSPVQDSYIKSIRNDKLGYYALIHYDYRTRQPKYTYEKFIQNFIKSNKVNRKGMNFYTDTAITADCFKIRPKDYQDSKYDRGHMIPAADMSSDQDLLAFTFSMTNISPQNPELNKHYWAKFEAWLRNQYETGDYEEFEIITGPVYAPIRLHDKWMSSCKTIGNFPNLIPVPTHFFKVVRGVKYVPLQSNDNQTLQQVVIGCFLVPNENIDPQIPVIKFVIKLERLEALVGLRFFDSSLSEIERINVDKFLPDISEVELAFYEPDPTQREIKEKLLLTDSNSSINQTSNKKESKGMIEMSKSMNYSPLIHICQTTPCYKTFTFRK